MNARADRLALQLAQGPRPTRLQRRYVDFAHAVDHLEQLHGRERAVGLDLARRRLDRALVAHRPLLEEWGLAA